MDIQILKNVFAKAAAEVGKKNFDAPCWEGYEQIGTKIVDGREVPNCVPVKEEQSKVKEGFPIPSKSADESDEEYISKCMKAIGGEYEQEQALAICYAQFAEVGPRGGIRKSDKAPKSDTPNKDPKGEGSAKGDASGKGGAKVTAAQEKTLEGKVKDFNEKESNTKNGNATLGALKSVFQRGLGAFNTSHSPKVRSAEQWAYARVNAFLYLLKNGRPENPKYDTDFDLLPKGHPKNK
jgi:hypothetical protein